MAKKKKATAVKRPQNTKKPEHKPLKKEVVEESEPEIEHKTSEDTVMKQEQQKLLAEQDNLLRNWREHPVKYWWGQNWIWVLVFVVILVSIVLYAAYLFNLI